MGNDCLFKTVALAVNHHQPVCAGEVAGNGKIEAHGLIAGKDVDSLENMLMFEQSFCPLLEDLRHHAW